MPDDNTKTTGCDHSWGQTSGHWWCTRCGRAMSPAPADRAGPASGDETGVRHAMLHDTGTELVCACGVLLSNYGLMRTTVSLFAQHVREESRLAAVPAPADRGICGDRSARLILAGGEGRVSVCVLLAGHTGWHHGDDGSDWNTPAAVPAPDTTLQGLDKRVAALAESAESGGTEFTRGAAWAYRMVAELLAALAADDGTGQ